MDHPTGAVRALALAAVLTSAPVFAVDRITLELGAGDDDTPSFGVAVSRDWDARWFDSGDWYLGGYWELGVSRWFADDDRGFATDELRAVWAHALSIPTVATPNRGVAAHSLLRDPQAWRDLLVAHGVPTAPVSIGRAPAGSCWLHADGSLRPRPDARVVRTLGMATVPARRWRSVVCCGGEVEPGLPRAIDTIARSAAQVLAGAGR